MGDRRGDPGNDHQHNSTQDSRTLLKESKGDSKFRKDSPFASSAEVGRRCWARTGPGTWGTFTMISKASVMWTGVTKERRCSCRTFRWGTISTNSVHSKKLSPSTLEISWRTLCALDVKNTSANGTSLNWRRSKQEVSNSVGYALRVRTGCVRGMSSSTIRMLRSSKRIKEAVKSKFTYLNLS